MNSNQHISSTGFVIESGVEMPKVRGYKGNKGYVIKRAATGHVKEVTFNLRKWCRDNKQNYGRMYQTISGKCKPVNGYVAETL